MKRKTKKGLIFNQLVGKVRMPKNGFYNYLQYVWHVVDCIVDDVVINEHYEISGKDTSNGQPLDILI